MTKKHIWLYIVIAVLCIAFMVGTWFALEAMGYNPKDFIPVRPIGPIVPPSIRIPKF